MAKHNSKQAKHKHNKKFTEKKKCRRPDKAITNQSVTNAMWFMKLQAVKG